MTLFQGLMVLQILLLLPIPCCSQCPYGFTMTKSRTACYAAFYALQSRDHAKRLCAAQYESILPTFRNAKDITEMRDAIKIPFEFWYGANALGMSETYVFDKSNFLMDDPGNCKFPILWDNLQPNKNLDKCTVLYSPTNKVHNIPCSFEKQVVCQLRLPAFGCGVHDISNFVRLCPFGFVPTRSKSACYRSFENDVYPFIINHFKARRLCRSHSGSLLPMFRDAEDMDEMMEAINIPGAFHLGANQIRKHGDWVMDNRKDPCEPWLPWGYGQPNDPNEKCSVLYKDKTAHDWTCRSKHAVVCQFRLPNFGCGVHKLSRGADCPDGFVRTRTRTACYMAIPMMQNRYHARNICGAYAGSILPTFRDAGDITDMNIVLYASYDYHVGANSIAREKKWVKDHKDSCSLYLPWDFGQPNNGIERCAVMHKDKNKLHDYTCKTDKRVVCQIRLKRFGCGVSRSSNRETGFGWREGGQRQTMTSEIDLYITLKGTADLAIFNKDTFASGLQKKLKPHLSRQGVVISKSAERHKYSHVEEAMGTADVEMKVKISGVVTVATFDEKKIFKGLNGKISKHSSSLGLKLSHVKTRVVVGKHVRQE